VCVLYGCEEKQGFSLYGINLLVFITEMESVYCVVRTETLNIIQVLDFKLSSCSECCVLSSG